MALSSLGLNLKTECGFRPGDSQNIQYFFIFSSFFLNLDLVYLTTE